VDVTNYVLMETGQPLHSFDYAKLAEGRIVVRCARPGEKLETIDHTQLELGADMLVIADANEPVALAGVMGGLASEVGQATTTVLLESAHFDPLSVRRTSRTLTLASESSFRFERNVDIVAVEWASRRTAALLTELAAAQVAPGLIDLWPSPFQPRQLSLRLARLNKLLGIEIAEQRVMQILQNLGFAPQLADGIVTCMGPSWRRDVAREADLIEEVIRIHGYEHIPTAPSINITVKTTDAVTRTRQKVTTALTGCGFYETMSPAFMEERHIGLFAEDGFQPVRVRDLSRRSNNALRHCLLPGLMAARRRNQAVGNGRCDFYEFSPVHEPDNSGSLPKETIMLGLLTDGDFRELRGIIAAVLRSLDKRAVLTCEPAELLWAAPQSAARLRVGDDLLGSAGVANEQIIKTFDLEQPVCLAEICFDRLVQLEASQTPLQPLPRFPGITRDLSLVLDESLPWSRIEALIWRQNIDDLQEVNFVDIFRGPGVEPGKKSLTLSMLFRRAEETLTREQVDQYQQKILAALQDQLAAVLRGN